MNERTWWATHVKRYWHQPLLGRVAWHVQDHANSGFPDVLVNFNGFKDLIELKYDNDWPARPTTKVLKDESMGGKGLTVEQRRHLEIWAQANNGDAWVLYGVRQEWFLMALKDMPKEGLTRDQVEQLAIRAGDSYKTLSHVPTYFEAMWRS